MITINAAGPGATGSLSIDTLAGGGFLLRIETPSPANSGANGEGLPPAAAEIVLARQQARFVALLLSADLAARCPAEGEQSFPQARPA